MSFMDSWNKGAQVGREQRQNRTLREFMQPATQGNQGALATLWKEGLGEQAMGAQNYHSQQVKTQQDAQQAAHKELGGLAAGVVQAAQGGDPARLQGSYQALLQRAKAMDPNADLPDAFDPNDLPHIYKLVAMGGGQDEGSMPSSFREFQLAAKNPQYGEFLSARQPQQLATIPVPGGTQAVWANPRSRTLTGLDGQPFGQPSQPQPAGPQSGQPFTIDPSLPPEVKASIRNNEQAWASAPDGAGVQIPTRQPAPTGGLGFKPNEPKATDKPSDLERKLEIARSMGATPEQLKQMVVGGPAKAAGPKGPKPLSVEAANKVGLYDNALRAAQQWHALVLGKSDGKFTGSYNDVAARTPQARALLQQALRAKLRAESGASISESEIEGEVDRYMGGLMSSDATNVQKANALLRDLATQKKSLAGTAGGGYQVGQMIEVGGKTYRVKDVSDPNDPDLEEVN